MWLAKCLKRLVFSEHLATVNILSSLKNCTTALPSDCVMTLAKVDLESVRLSASQKVGVFVNALTGDGSYPLRNRRNLQLSIQPQLDKKQKCFSQFFAAYPKAPSNF